MTPCAWRRHINPPPKRPDKTPSKPMRGRVVVLTDYWCNSACLYMLDVYLRLPNLIHAGVPTNADTIFMEVGTAGPPSGKAAVTFGHKARISDPGTRPTFPHAN